jgi:hypothetical protein
MFIDDKDDSKALNSIQKVLIHNLQKKHYLREKKIKFLNGILNNIHQFNNNSNDDVYMDVDIDYNTNVNDIQGDIQGDIQDVDIQGDIHGDIHGDIQGVKKSVEFSKSPIVKESTVSQVFNNITDFIFN